MKFKDFLRGIAETVLDSAYEYTKPVVVLGVVLLWEKYSDKLDKWRKKRFETATSAAAIAAASPKPAAGDVAGIDARPDAGAGGLRAPITATVE